MYIKIINIRIRIRINTGTELLNPAPIIQSPQSKVEPSKDFGPKAAAKVYEIIADLIVPDDAGEEALDAPPEECPVIIKMDVLYTTAYHCTSVPKLPNWTRTSY